MIKKKKEVKKKKLTSKHFGETPLAQESNHFGSTTGPIRKHTKHFQTCYKWKHHECLESFRQDSSRMRIKMN